jgi:hypothetical protein
VVDVQRLPHAVDVGDEVAVAEQHPLRVARGARRVLDEGRFVAPRGVQLGQAAPAQVRHVHHALEALGGVRDLADERADGAPRHTQARARVLGDVRQALEPRLDAEAAGRVGRHGDGADHLAREEDRQEVHAGGEHDQDAVAAPRPQVAQAVGDAARVFIELAVGHDLGRVALTLRQHGHAEVALELGRGH